MAFHNILFPSQISFGALGGPAIKVQIKTNPAGREKRRKLAVNPDYAWDVAFGLQEQADLDLLLAFWHGREGRLHSFPFKDWSNYTVGLTLDGESLATAQTFGTGDGFQTAFQLFRRHSDGFTITDIDITLPVNGTLLVFIDTVLKSEGPDYSVDYATGIVTFASAPAGAEDLTFASQYHWKARFDIERFNPSLDFYRNYTWGQIIVRSVPQDET